MCAHIILYTVVLSTSESIDFSSLDAAVSPKLPRRRCRSGRRREEFRSNVASAPGWPEVSSWEVPFSVLKPVAPGDP